MNDKPDVDEGDEVAVAVAVRLATWGLEEEAKDGTSRKHQPMSAADAR